MTSGSAPAATRFKALGERSFMATLIVVFLPFPIDLVVKEGAAE
jgi:hypothetical protein